MLESSLPPDSKRAISRRILVAPFAVAARRVGEVVEDADDLLHRSGDLREGKALITTVIALLLGTLSLLAVLAFHFPQYLTMPELRHKYSVDVLRQLLFAGLLVAGALSLTNLIFNRRRNLNLVAFTC